MTILGIDPGPTETAWCVYGGGKVIAFGKDPNDNFTGRLEAYVDRNSICPVDLFAVEAIASYGMAVGAEVFETCMWIGEFRRILKDRQARWRLFYRKDVKMHLCHSMKANDSNIRAAIIDKLGPPGRKASPGPTYGLAGDCWSALAVAITADETSAP